MLRLPSFLCMMNMRHLSYGARTRRRWFISLSKIAVHYSWSICSRNHSPIRGNILAVVLLLVRRTITSMYQWPYKESNSGPYEGPHKSTLSLHSTDYHITELLYRPITITTKSSFHLFPNNQQSPHPLSSAGPSTSAFTSQKIPPLQKLNFRFNLPQLPHPNCQNLQKENRRRRRRPRRW